MRWALGLCLSAGVGAGSLFWPRLAPAAALVVLVAVLTQPRVQLHRRWFAAAVHGIAGIAIVVGLYRFIRDDGMRGIVGGGRRAAESTAVGRLRELVIAQDVARKRAVLDPDGDGVGSALALSELVGGPRRLGTAPPAALVEPRRFSGRRATSAGDAFVAGAFLYLVCLPRVGGGFTTATTDVDDEAAERRWVAYAWPLDETSTMNDAFFVDEREAILVLRHTGGASPRYVGGRAPRCAAALEDEGWRAWRNKTPKTRLPGAEG